MVNYIFKVLPSQPVLHELLVTVNCLKNDSGPLCQVTLHRVNFLLLTTGVVSVAGVISFDKISPLKDHVLTTFAVSHCVSPL